MLQSTLVGAEIIELSRLGDPKRAAVPAIAIENDADVAGCRPTLDVADKPTSIEVVEQAEHRRQRSFPLIAQDYGTAVTPHVPAAECQCAKNMASR